jgi:hypothetical protein
MVAGGCWCDRCPSLQSCIHLSVFWLNVQREYILGFKAQLLFHNWVSDKLMFLEGCDCFQTTESTHRVQMHAALFRSVFFPQRHDADHRSTLGNHTVKHFPICQFA